jgi:hypothetical protein
MDFRNLESYPGIQGIKSILAALGHINSKANVKDVIGGPISRIESLLKHHHEQKKKKKNKKKEIK